MSSHIRKYTDVSGERQATHGQPVPIGHQALDLLVQAILFLGIQGEHREREAQSVGGCLQQNISVCPDV